MDALLKYGAAEGMALEESFESYRVEGPCPASSGDASALVGEDPARLEDPERDCATAQLNACS